MLKESSRRRGFGLKGGEVGCELVGYLIKKCRYEFEG
jgi:hypothetical protein